jgi:low affinity Fe/Cu permease
MKGGIKLMKQRFSLKAIGIVATVIGFGVTLLTNWVDDKKMDEKIDEKVNEALAARNEEEP